VLSVGLNDKTTHGICAYELGDGGGGRGPWAALGIELAGVSVNREGVLRFLTLSCLGPQKQGRLTHRALPPCIATDEKQEG
jgi:hypothetical protein